MLKIIFYTALILSSAQLQAYDFQRIADMHVMPVYQRLVKQTIELDEAAKISCNEQSRENIEILQHKSSDAFLAWQGAQHLRFGPVQFFSREHRFAFWPDKRGVVGKQLNKLIQDPALSTENFDLTQKSIALQGFSALERLIYVDSNIDDKRCVLVAEITKNLRNMSEGILNDWVAGNDSYLKYFIKPNSKNLIYKTESELASELLNSFYTELEFIIKQKLDRPLGSNLEKGRGRLAEAWRSKSALPAIYENLNACYKLYQITFAPELVDDTLKKEIETSFQDAFSTLTKIKVPLSVAVGNVDQRTDVEQLRAQVVRIKHLVTRDMASQLELSLGFNSLDGD
ncbi:MAG: imelysin family protein [Gammaproteobacteria bacterium]